MSIQETLATISCQERCSLATRHLVQRIQHWSFKLEMEPTLEDYYIFKITI